jgi:4-amino-4-deoxy-L-arabinose transferase-like glycosyltransferase
MAVFVFCLLLNGPGTARRIRASAAGLAVFAAVLLPWILYMHDISGQWRLTPTQGGVNLWESNGRIFSSHFEDEEQGAATLFGPLREEMSGSIRKPWLAEFPEFRDEPEWVRDSILTDRTFEFLRANPLIVPRLVLLRFAEFFKPFPFNEFPLYYMLAGLLTFGTVLVFAGAGFARFARRRDPAGLLIVLVVAVYTLVHMASISGTPHRVALDVPLAVLAGSGLSLFLTRSGLSERLGRKQPDS